MSQITVLPQHAITCAGCLGHGTCWVCLGTGKLFRAFDRRIDCHRCGGTGLCAETLDRVIVLPDQRAAVI